MSLSGRTAPVRAGNFTGPAAENRVFPEGGFGRIAAGRIGRNPPSAGGTHHVGAV